MRYVILIFTLSLLGFGVPARALDISLEVDADPPKDTPPASSEPSEPSGPISSEPGGPPEMAPTDASDRGKAEAGDQGDKGEAGEPAAPQRPKAELLMKLRKESDEHDRGEVTEEELIRILSLDQAVKSRGISIDENNGQRTKIELPADARFAEGKMSDANYTYDIITVKERFATRPYVVMPSTVLVPSHLSLGKIKMGSLVRIAYVIVHGIRVAVQITADE